MHSKQTNEILKQNKDVDVVMNEFVSWCRHLLVPFLFHAPTSLHPPSFHRNGFFTCSNTNGFLMLINNPIVNEAIMQRRTNL